MPFAARLRTPFLLFACICLNVVAVCHAVESSALPPSFLQQMPAECTTLLFVNDPLPHLEQLLTSDRLNTALEQAFSQMPGGPQINGPQQALAKIKEYAAYIPQEIAIGVPETAYADITKLCRVGLLTALCYGAQQEGNAQANVLLQDQLLIDVKNTSFPRLVLYAKFRNESAALQVMALSAQMMNGLAPLNALTIGENSIHLKMSVADFFPAKNLALMVQRMRIIHDDDGTKISELAEAVGNVSVELSMERVETSLRLTLGKRPENILVLDLQQLSTLWKFDSELIYYAQWDITALRKPWRDLCIEWQQWESTPVGQAITKLDNDDLLGDLRASERTLNGLATSGSTRATAGENLELVFHEKDFPPSPPLTEVLITKLFPKNTTTKIADSSTTLGKIISNHFTRVENRMAIKSMQDNVQGEMAEVAMQTYYTRMRRLRKLVHEDSQTLFGPTVGILTATGQLNELSISFGDQPGNLQTRTVTNTKVTEFALIGRLQNNTEEGKNFYSNLYRAFFDVLGEPIEGEVTEQRDLGLGVSAMVFLPVFQNRLPFELRISASGDLLPHYFVLDEWLILSTSPRLSKAIVDAKALATSEVQISNTSDKLVTLGWMSGEAIAQLVQDLGTLIKAMSPERSNRDATIHAFSNVARLIDQVKWFKTEGKDIRATNYQVVFAND